MSHREPWLVVDPKGLAGDLASDTLRVLARGRFSLREADDLGTELRRRLAIFADAAEIERDRAIRWTQADSATRALRSRKLGDRPTWVIQPLEQIAEILA